jgi:capsid protein
MSFSRTIRAASQGAPAPAASRDGSGSSGGVVSEMKQRTASRERDSRPALCSVNSYLEKNFPDFFAEARFQVGDDDYFLYARFGQYLARTIEQNRAPREKINRGFTVLNKMARASARNPGIRQILVSGPLEYIVDAPKARALARKRLSPVAQGYLESLCE